MAKFYGIIGFSILEERPSGEEGVNTGIYEETVVEKNYRGDILRNARRWEQSENLNDNLTINNTFSIIADSFALQNYQAMKYMTWSGSSWKITNIEIQRPRIIITVGGVYNGNEN